MRNLPSTTSAQHNFARVPQADIPRSTFNRSNGLKTTFNSDFLVPVFVDEVLPGDTFNLKMTAFARLATPLFPFMDNMYLDTFFFFVPNRLTWTQWERFNGEQNNPGDSVDFLIPQQVSPAVTGYLNGSLHDYMGIPTAVPGLSHSALPFRAYNLIYNDWFRDQNLQNSRVLGAASDGPDDPANYTLQRRGKRHDYFTSALPFPQKGPAVSVPLGSTAPIVVATTRANAIIRSTSTGAAFSNDMYSAPTTGVLTDPTGSAQLFLDPNGGLVADLSTATASTINQLRLSFQIQKLYERDDRGGSRYVEIIRSHFGVVSDDARFQRPEYLGGGSSPIIVNPIAQTSATSTQPTPQGNLAAMGTGTIVNHGFVRSFTEHGFIIGLVNVRADLTYQQGLDKMWTRKTRFDHYWPALSHIGEQAILNKEIYAVGSANLAQDEAVFGYQERHAEYRYKPSKITGQFRSNFAQTLDTWHLAQNFASLPLLNATFIQSNTPTARVLAVPSAPHFIMDAFFNLKCTRPMPVQSVPGLIDHF